MYTSSLGSNLAHGRSIRELKSNHFPLPCKTNERDPPVAVAVNCTTDRRFALVALGCDHLRLLSIIMLSWFPFWTLLLTWLYMYMQDRYMVSLQTFLTMQPRHANLVRLHTHRKLISFFETFRAISYCNEDHLRWLGLACSTYNMRATELAKQAYMQFAQFWASKCQAMIDV